MPLTEAEVKTRLQTMCQAALEPTLTDPELETLVRQAKRADGDGRRFYPAWEATRLYQLGALVAPDLRNGHYYEATVEGESDDTAPTWPTVSGSTVTDGDVTWAEAGEDEWVPSFDLNAAAAEGWLLKAGKAVHLYNAAAGASRFDRGQVYSHCITQANRYANKAVGSTPTSPPPAGA